MKQLLGLFLLSFAFFLSGCATEQNTKPEGMNSFDRADTLIIGIDIEPEFINPILDESGFDHLIYRGLMRFNENNQPEPDIARSYHTSADGLTYTFQLHENIKFQDGTLLTADDVVFTFESIFNDKTLSMVRPEYEEINRVEKINDFEVMVTLKNPFPPLLDKLTIGIIPEHVFKGKDINKATENMKPIGTGPYKLIDWEKGKKIVLQANEQAQKQPFIQNVVFKYIPDHNVRSLQLQTGEIDLTLLQPSQVEKVSKQSGIHIYNVDTADYRTMMFNMKKPLWQDINVRKAFSYAIDREAIVDGLLLGYGFPAYSPLQMNSYRNEEIEKYEFDIEKANLLLEQSGWILSNDGFRYKNGDKLAFTLATPASDETRTNMATYLASQFAKIGAEVKTEALDWSVIKIEDTDAFILGWGSPFDADDHTYKLFHSNEIGVGYNYGSYQNETIDELLTKARVTIDESKRKALYQQFQEELAEDPPYIFISYLKAVYGVNERVNGIIEKTLGHHGAGFVWNLEEWSLND